MLRNKLKDNNIFEFAPAFFICEEAQTAPPSALVNKYDNARKILENSNLRIEGDKLLKTIHFLTESELVPATPENITKSYITDVKTYYDIKPEIEDALGLLTESKILLLSNNIYKITSDLETKLLDEMNDFNVELFIKKRNLINNIKNSSILRNIAGISENNTKYLFNVTSDLDDEIFPSTDKYLQIRLYSLYSINEGKEEFIETVKLGTQYEKGKISIIPNNISFKSIDTLLEEIQKITYVQEKYGNDSDTNIRQIVREFSIIKEEKEKALRDEIDSAYTGSSAIYLFDTKILDKDNFNLTINDLQKKVIKNVYTKRPPVQLSEKIAEEIIKEKSDEQLHRYNNGDDYKFFDQNGNFIGESLKVIEEVTSLINTSFADGKTVEELLRRPPTGYEYGTVATSLAVLFRAGRVTIKYKGSDYFSYRDEGVLDIFSNSRNFQKASFKSLKKSLNASQKNEIVQVLMDLNYKEITGEPVDWNTNDFQLVDAIRNIAELFLNTVSTLRKTVNGFDTLFSSVNLHTNQLAQFTGKTTEGNYIDRVDHFLDSKDDFKEAAKGIQKIESFVKKNLDKANTLKRFVDELVVEIEKSDIRLESINEGINQFNGFYKNSIVDNYKGLIKIALKVKDEYFDLITAENDNMSKQHKVLRDRAQNVINEIMKFPEELNKDNRMKAEGLVKYAEQRINEKVDLGDSIQCRNCKMSLSEMKNSIALLPSKETELILIQSNIVKEKDAKQTGTDKGKPKKIGLSLTRKMTVKEYRELLTGQLEKLIGLDDEDTVEIDIEKK